jgi:signal transduction histidine kinase
MTAAFAVAFAALILVFGGFLLWFARHDAAKNADAMLEAAADKVLSEYSDSLRESDPSGLSDVTKELAMQNLALLIVNPQGRIVQGTPGSVPAWPRPDEEKWRVRTIMLGSDTAVIGYPWQKTETTLRAQAGMLIALSLLLFLSATFGAWLLVGRTLSPLYGLCVQADAASAENLRVRLDAPSQDAEMVHLVRTLNALLARLAGAISARERFYAAASHELRTPLQTLTGYLEYALMRRRNAEEYRAVVAEAYSQSVRLSSLVQALLLLNRLDATPPREKETVCLGESCRRWLRQFQPLAAARRLRVEACLPEDVTLLAIPSHADILLHNLLENALKYATEGSEVHLGVVVLAEETRLTLFNRCPALPEWEEARLFEPFYRPDASRNSDTGGNGLGLAICKAIAVANGWNLTVRQEGEGVRAEVAFK